MRRMLGCVLSGALTLTLYAVPEEYRAVLMDDWTRVSFEGVAVDTPLTRDLGATGGDWGEDPIPEGATAVVATNKTAASYLAFDTSDSVECLRYTTSSGAPDGSVVANFDMSFTKTDTTFTMPEDARAGLMIIQRDGESPHFVGFCRAGWVDLTASDVTPAFDTWYAGQARFKTSAGRAKVSYWIQSNGTYRPLADANDVYWLDLAGDGEAFWNQVSFKGVGGVSGFNGEFYGKGLRIGVKEGETP